MRQIYIGIDIAKNLHYASIVDSFGEVLEKPFPFENNIDGYKILISKTDSYSKEDCIFEMESTAHYADNLVNYLLTRTYNVRIINPIQTHALRKTNIRDAKNDKIDSMTICQALTLNLGSIVTLEDTLKELHDLSISYRNIMTMRSKSKIQYITYLDKSFPELAKEFKASIHGKAIHELLKQYPLPSKINKVRMDKLTNILSTNSHGKYKRDKAERLKELCRNTIGIQHDSLGIQIQLAIAQIELYSNQLEEIKSQMTNIVESLDSPIMTIPGMGVIQAAAILSSIKDINCFSSPSKVLAYAGLDPRVRQSGNFSAVSTHMSKRGSSLLRYALIMAAHNVVKNNKTFKDYYEKKRSEGKRHYNALGHSAHKLVRVIFTLLTTNKSFDLD